MIMVETSSNRMSIQFIHSLFQKGAVCFTMRAVFFRFAVSEEAEEDIGLLHDAG